MPGPFLDRDREFAVQLEAAWGTSPGALAGSDFFKHLTGAKLEKVLSSYARNRDRDRRRASVLSTHKGRESSSWSVPCDLIPANVAGTPTAPDIDPFLEAHLGSKRTATAHTTLDAGSTATVLALVAGGAAASGVLAGDMIAVDVSAAFGIEVRQVTLVAGENVTLDRALSAAPAAARNVYVGTTYRLSEQALKSVHLWEFVDGDNFRHSAGGCIVQNMSLDIDFAQENPLSGIVFDGVGGRKVTASTARPTPVTAGIPHIPTEGKVWIGTALTRIIKYGLKSNNGLALRMNDSTSLYPTGTKRTDNDSRYKAEQTMDLLLQTGTIEGYYDNDAALTAYDVIVQLGVTVGQIVAIRTPKFVPTVPEGVTDGEVSLSLGGPLYGVVGDDEYSIAFI